MAPDKKGNSRNRIPIKFLDSDNEADPGASKTSSKAPRSDDDQADDEQDLMETMDEKLDSTATAPAAVELESTAIQPSPQADGSPGEVAPQSGGPEVAELVATRAELRRLEAEVKELRDGLARRQADFENYRKRTDRERAATYNRVVADIAAKLLPVLDNLKRALDTEASIEATESDEFRHFLSGVDLVYKQLAGVLDAMGVKPVLAEGEQFDPHLHEAVVTEPTDDYEPDTVMQEIVRGFTIGDKLIRPALVKVAVKK
jgi:molecular chaperone GrpE